MSTENQIRQNYHEETQDKVNKQINMELYASYVYLAMAYHFDRDDVAFLEIADFFRECSSEEREHAMKFMKFQNLRGGTISLENIEIPPKSEWNSPLEAMEDALQLETRVNQSLLDLHMIATKHKDSQMCDFLEKEYLNGQLKEIKKFADYMTKLKRVGTGLGEYVFGKNFK